MDSIIDIKRAYQEGRITRESFWRSMQARHLQLRDYQKLIAGGEVSSIEILSDELHITTSDGIILVWYPEDLRTAPDILVNSGTYEPVESAALMRAAEGARVIFDVGANVGYYSMRWAKSLGAGGSIHAFEPVPLTYERLRRNIELNELGNIIQAINAGLGETPGSLNLFVPAFSGSSAASIRNLHPDETSVEVEACIDTLDDYFKRSGLTTLDLVKVDVEGAELLVLKGALRTIDMHRPLLFMELLRKWSKPFGYHPNDVLALLGGLGYACYSHEEANLVHVPEITDETVQTNFFFAHPQRHDAWLTASDLRANTTGS